MSTSTATGGVGFGGLLALVFITLKLCSVIDWSWWWVLCPLWGPITLLAVVFMAVFTIAIIAACFEGGK